MSASAGIATPDDGCGCDEYGPSRRSILKAAGLASLAGVTTSMFGDVLTSTVFGATEGNILVVVSLRGGADGLSMIVPHAESAYYAARPTTSIARGELIGADSTFGLHPAFAPLTGMWTRGQMAGIHAVGLPVPNRSHFEAMELLEDADPGSSERIGWINRMISGLASVPDVLDGVQIGSTITPTALVGPAPSLSTSGFDDLLMPFHADATMRQRVTATLKTQYAVDGPLKAAGTGAFALAARAGEIDSAVGAGPPSGVTYPEYSALGEALGATAGLIRAKVGVKAVAVDAGGWDHHVDLRWRVKSTIGDLAACLAAFFTDLGPDAGRVTVVTLSEFGRRLTENGSRGVDHGYGNAVFALGAGVVGGRFYSRWPTLGTGSQIDGDLAVTTDYRSVLMEVLAARFPSLDLSRVFPGVKAAPFGFMG
ncbi:DUF1501 domain-containing protein [Aeromicrobium fastidiosum]|uniref:DUF1501 domain-containing protein n=1 Tax=Aeromicrobium fastidiosum TaxID=52699 RepID=A0A641ARU3_9ACTN|nr:DUF1501 domain-containing protein [Aeromicrobium fastidiosum]KAA1380800.1 DUF1501 domain-containing protein [Aeromicrobium fastidiosum]MBP2390423.1 uncharacterized protein (DUF1501 family) [Aeromicrobium fastidiosum]